MEAQTKTRSIGTQTEGYAEPLAQNFINVRLNRCAHPIIHYLNPPGPTPHNTPEVVNKGLFYGQVADRPKAKPKI